MAVTATTPSFTAPPELHSFVGLLFDNDGTLIDSTSVVIKYWTRLAKEIGVDPEVVLATAHGRRSIDTMSLLKPELATWEFVREHEGRIPVDFPNEVKAVPGAHSLLQSVAAAGVPWTIVTSATEPLVTGWLKVMGLARPPHLITAETVQKGKPDPECYLLGAKKLGLENEQGSAILVFEDAISGIKASKAAGYKVVALTTTHTIDELRAAGPDWIVKDLDSIRLKGWDSQTKRAQIEITNALIN